MTRIVYVVNSDFFFLSHRLPLALEAARRGRHVTVIAPDTGRLGEIAALGLEVVDLPLSRSGTGLVQEWTAVRFLRRELDRLRPDLVHLVTSKPMTYGAIALWGRDAPTVNSVSGLGYAFTSGRGGILRRVMEQLYRFALRRPRAWSVFQNDDDYAAFEALGAVVPSRSVFIRGSGVDLEAFPFVSEPAGVPVVLLPARLLWDKGVGEFVEAARIVRDRGLEARFVLVGKLDPGNPAAVPQTDLEAWLDEGIVEWWGYRTDMPDVYRQATVVALPSYREGLPKALLEAGAAGRAIVTTDVPGCRDVVEDGVTGLIVPARDAQGLADAVAQLLDDAGKRDALRHAARRYVEDHHSIEHIVAQHFELYDRALGMTA